MSSQPLKSYVSSSWGVSCRPTLLFVVAFALNVTPHEIVHAITSYLLGFNSTVFQMWVNPDSAEATPRQLATIAVSGPLFSLAVGARYVGCFTDDGLETDRSGSRSCGHGELTLHASWTEEQ